jgi:hypothetical protein
MADSGGELKEEGPDEGSKKLKKKEATRKKSSDEAKESPEMLLPGETC